MNGTPIAVVLARGLGTRMRRQAEGIALADDQSRLADTGLKALIPVGRPFLDYVLSGLADAGIRDVCLVIGPEHDVVRDYYGQPGILSRVTLSFAVQDVPRGTADAVVAAGDMVGDREFLVLNGDNYAPLEALRALAALDGPGLVAFGREAMIRESNVEADRVRQFAVVRVGSDDTLQDIVEKPDEATLAAFGDDIYLSMNYWRFDRRVLDACRRVTPSPRGELEIPDGVRLACRDGGVSFRVIRMHAGVLDLSSRSDISAVAARLAGVQVKL
ncbi:MAG: nucleotidyltransferase family protein [Acidobacteriota bacterium]